MGAYGLYDILELFKLIQVCWVLDQGIEEAHALKDVGKVSWSVILEFVKEMGEDYALRENLLDLIKHFIALVLDVCSLGHTALDEWHADWADVIDQALWDRVQEVLHAVKLQFKWLKARMVFPPVESFNDQLDYLGEFRPWIVDLHSNFADFNSYEMSHQILHGSTFLDLTAVLKLC